MLRRYSIACIVSIGLFILFIRMTNPSDIPTIFYIAPFLIMFVAVFSFVMLAGAVFVKLQLLSISRGLLKRLSTLVALYTVFLVLLKSIGQLTARDVVIGLILVTFLYVYFDRMTNEKPIS